MSTFSSVYFDYNVFLNGFLTRFVFYYFVITVWEDGCILSRPWEEGNGKLFRAPNRHRLSQECLDQLISIIQGREIIHHQKKTQSDKKKST